MRTHTLGWSLIVSFMTVYATSRDNQIYDAPSSRQTQGVKTKKGVSERKEIVNILEGDSLNPPKIPIFWKKSNLGRYKRDDDQIVLEENIPARTNRHLPLIQEPEIVAHHRSKRTTVQLTQQEKDLLLALQNIQRSGEGSSNMEYNTWNEVLAEMSQDWANNCRWGHGFPDYGENKPYEYIGQNIFAWSGSVLNFTHAAYAWFNEKYIYDYDTGACSGDCGHYTQIVWASTRQIGCGLATCPGMVGGTADQYLVCNYGPAGNWIGEQPFKKGPSCSQCESGSSWCTDNMCDTEGCENGDRNCVCLASCHNCGIYDEETCSCSCADGWASTDCSKVCKDHHENCGANPGWPASWCLGGGFSENIYRACWALCGRCVQAEQAVLGCEVVGPGLNGTASILQQHPVTMTTLTFLITITLQYWIKYEL